MKNPGGKRSVDAAALRKKLAELEGLRAELQAKYDRLLAEREALKRKSEGEGTDCNPAAAEAPKKTTRQRQIKRKRATVTSGQGKIRVGGDSVKKGS